MSDHAFTSHDGTEIAVRDHRGDGPDVLFLHGAMRNLEDWGAVLPHLDAIRAVTMDLRFHGHSGVSAALGPTDPARDIETVVEGLGLLHPYVVGHSMGGVSALLYAADHPDCPGALNIDGYDIRQPEFYDELPEESVREFLDQFAARSGSFVPMEDEGDDAWREQQVAIMRQMDTAWGVPSDVTEAVAGRSFVPTTDGRWARRPPSTFWSLTIQTGTLDVLSLLRRVSCPVTVLVCTKAMPMQPANDFFAAGKRGVERHLLAIAAERPNLRVVTIDATHGVIYEQPEEIARLVMSLLSP